MGGEIQNYNESIKGISDKLIKPLTDLEKLNKNSAEFLKKAQGVVTSFNSINWPSTVTPRMDQMKLDVNILKINPKLSNGQTLVKNLQNYMLQIEKSFPRLNQELTTFANGAVNLSKKYPGARGLIDQFNANSTFLGKYRLMENAKAKIVGVINMCNAQSQAFDGLDKDLAQLEIAAIQLRFPIDLGVDLAQTMIPGMQVGKAARVVKWLQALNYPQLLVKAKVMFAARPEELARVLKVYNSIDFGKKMHQIFTSGG